jgi:hypothetical protein
VLLVGPHGIGKSEILEQAAKELEIGYIVRDLSLMEPPDLAGMPQLSGEVTRFLPPAFLPTTGKGILCFEELNRCAQYMRGPCLQLLTAGVLNDYTLPSGWLPVAAINPADSDYEVADLDPALLSRFVVANVVPDRAEWLRWAEGNGVHQAVVGFVGDNAQIFEGKKGSNPRAWKYASDVLKTYDNGGHPRPVLEAAILGLVGTTWATAFRDFRRNGSAGLPPLDDLLDQYPHHRQRVKDWTAKGATDKLTELTHSVKLALQSEDVYRQLRADRKRWRSLGQFLNDLPADLADELAIFAKDYARELPPRRSRC